MPRTRWMIAVLIVTVLGVRSTAASSCYPRNVEVWPPSGPIPSNVVWVVDAAGPDLAEKLELVGDGESIGLIVVKETTARVRDEYAIQQYVLRAATPLRAGTEYRMPWPLPMPGRTIPPLGIWQVSADEDRLAPAFQRGVNVDYRFRANSCGGASRSAHFDIDATEPVLAAVTIARGGGDADPEQILLAGSGGTLYGSGWCSGGNFSFDPLADRYTGTIRLMDAAGNWSSAQPFAFETAAEMRPFRRTSADAVTGALPKPHPTDDLFDDAQWKTAVQFLADSSATRRSPRAFVPYDASLLQRWSFLGMPEEEARRLLGRGGEPSDLSPPLIVRYDYLMAPPPAGYHVWLKLGLGFDDHMRVVVVSEEFAPCRYEDPADQYRPRDWDMCSPYGVSSPRSDTIQVCS